ncbi:uncharacterized protein PV09_00583 [Verruconis gallopava]|uniref:DUF7624 domain-containing protein n=1 Tax=Verruconis gallopava TaxID=253628 RepID=A0A0D1Z6P0_9PEZI|nr:uncharacterized protein PV09_00583 [Verruconis gallopava]KIW08627.1 hypothetical protein PV09_00583 [Verruconis gallopava]
MAMTTTLVPSPSLNSSFSPYTDSPSSPAPYSVAFRPMNRQSTGSEKDSLAPPPSPYPATVDPSPVESNDSHSTDVTDIDAEDVHSPSHADGLKSPDIEIISPASGMSAEDVSPLPHIDTNIIIKDSEDGQPQSVIHAPTGFKQFDTKKTAVARHSRRGSSPSETSEHTAVVSPTTPESADRPEEKKQHLRDSAPPLNTQVLPARLGSGGTPRASTIQEAEEEWRRRSWASNKSQSLEDIAEADDHERSDTAYAAGQVGSIGEALKSLNSAEKEVASLKTALSECWTLCNTLANLSSMHRERMFSFSGSGDVQEQAWRSCWKLCQNLYESRDEDHNSQVRPTLELCREFCQALFEARQRGDEVTDSILRVSFELNNHLYNIHDRNLPDAFRERTLDFYLTMCHRLMKQRTSLPEETDALLRACWTLAELLFSLRQNNRDSRAVDEELLGSAVQACWDLCDLFREGWTQIRPERGTPRPTKTTFQPNPFPSNLSQSTSSRPESSASGTFHSVDSFPPETPTTIYDDRDDMSPAEMAVPNILVLGPENPRWSSNNSVTGSMSGYSESSQRTARSASRALQHTPPPVVQQDSEDPNLLRLKTLIVKAALNIGFGRQSPTTLTAFVKTLPSTAFGTQSWQMKLFESYRKLVLTDPSLRGDHRTILPQGRRMSASEIGRAVQWMSRNESFSWFKDLFKLVFGFGPEEAAGKKGVGVQI